MTKPEMKKKNMSMLRSRMNTVKGFISDCTTIGPQDQHKCCLTGLFSTCAGFTCTGHSRYVDFAYLDTTTYVEVIFHSQHLFSIFLCISTPSMLKTVNTKQRVSRGDFSCPRLFSIIFASVYVEVLNLRSHGRHIVCFGYVHALAEVQTSSKQQ